MHSSAAKEYCRELIHESAAELASAFDDARQSDPDVVMMIVEAQDSLGRLLCNQLALKETHNVVALPAATLLNWLGPDGTLALDARTADFLIRQTSTPVAAAVMRVVVVAREHILFELVRL